MCVYEVYQMCRMISIHLRCIFILHIHTVVILFDDRILCIWFHRFLLHTYNTDTKQKKNKTKILCIYAAFGVAWLLLSSRIVRSVLSLNERRRQKAALHTHSDWRWRRQGLWAWTERGCSVYRPRAEICSACRLLWHADRPLGWGAVCGGGLVHGNTVSLCPIRATVRFERRLLWPIYVGLQCQVWEHSTVCDRVCVDSFQVRNGHPLELGGLCEHVQ